MKKLTTEEFIIKANEIHNFKYDYTKTVYIKSNSKVKIICPKHGVFEQTPNNHLSNRGCYKCGGWGKNEDEYIIDFNKIHNFKYDYSNFIFNGIYEKIKIICPEHGIFEQSVSNHLRGRGCPKCVGKNLTLDEFISECNKIHNYKFDYSLVDYPTENKIKIICPKHGIFEQNPSNHKSGSSCPECKKENTKYDLYKDKKTTLYYIKINNLYKIGLTQSTINKRFLGENIDYKVIFEKEFEDGWEAFKLEQNILKCTKQFKIKKDESPIKGGWSEIRTQDILEIIMEKLKTIN